jgi:hypothetical protein
VPGVRQGDVFLFAPHGTVDAGDAGVRANLVVVGALQVLNADNIQANKSIGLPTVPATNTSALTAADNSAAAASKVENPKANSDHGGPSVIIVEVLGYGGSDGSDADDRPRSKPDQRSYNPGDPIRIVGYGPLGRRETQDLTAEEQHKLSRQ